MKDSIIYDDIFEAVKALEPGNPLGETKERDGILVRHQNATVVELDDGSITALPLSSGVLYYRGECRQYPESRPNIYRKSKSEQVVWNVRRCDFEIFLLEVPEIKRRLENNEKVDLLAISQHYGFPTNMLDVTSDLIIAAYFATHDRNRVSGQMEPVADGIGRLFWGTFFPDNDGKAKIRMFGDQFYRRPLSQCAYGLDMKEEEDLKDICGYLEFKQSAEMGERMDRCFDGQALVYPPEQISAIAKIIQQTDAVTSAGIKRYSEESGIEQAYIEKPVEDAGIYIVDAPLCHPAVIREWANAEPMFIPAGQMRPGMVI